MERKRKRHAATARPGRTGELNVTRGAFPWRAFAAHALFLLFAAAAFLVVGLFPMNDSASFRMTDADWMREALHRFMLLAVLAAVAGLFSFASQRMSVPLTDGGLKRGAWTWAAATFLLLLLWAVAVAARFLATRPYF